jgi:hypothetical protein
MSFGGIMTTITPEQRVAAAEAGEAPVEIADPQTGAKYILLRSDVYQRMRQRLEDIEARREQESWSQLSRKARDQWASENSY